MAIIELVDRDIQAKKIDVKKKDKAPAKETAEQKTADATKKIKSK